MAQTYFTLPSFARAKQHKETLEKTNPQTPVLNDEDEKFLQKITSNESSNEQRLPIPQSEIANDGAEEDIKPEAPADKLAIPATQIDGDVDDPPESVPEQDDVSSASKSQQKRGKKDPFIELPSQEEAEAATKGFASGTQNASSNDGEKKTWTSYLPSISRKKDANEIAAGTSQEKSPQLEKDGRTWAEYASSYVPNATVPTMSAAFPLMPALPSYMNKSKDSKPEPVLNEDGTVNEEATKEKQEKEVSVLLDNLNLSSINNRVFAFSQESQKLYERFIQVLKDVMNGVPTAYDDMEKFMKDAGPTIEKQWNAMPPFVQTLAKSLPAKLSATLAPELLAATGAKASIETKQTNEKSSSSKNGGKQKKKRYLRVPGLKSLVNKEGMAATMLTNISTFLKTRFPLLMGMTNVAMSLSVFILMFVFYYCWKRGRQVRLAKEAEAAAQAAKAEEYDDDVEIEVTADESDDDQPEQTATEKTTKEDFPTISTGTDDSQTPGMHHATKAG